VRVCDGLLQEADKAPNVRSIVASKSGPMVICSRVSSSPHQAGGGEWVQLTARSNQAVRSPNP
jgi:hypothetical protein